MNNVRLQETPPRNSAERPWTVQPGRIAAEPPTAWRVSGADPADWLRELLAWPAALADVQILPLPLRDGMDGVGGVLAIPPLGQGPREASPRVLPYVRRGGKMYLPADAELSPPSTDAEIAASAVDDLLVFAPGIGWIGADLAELRSAAELISAPSSSAAVWEHAAPGWPPPRPLRGVRLVGENEPLVPPPTAPAAASDPESAALESADVDALLLEPAPAPPAFAPVEDSAPPQPSVGVLKRVGIWIWGIWNVVRNWTRRRVHALVLWMVGDRDSAAAQARNEPPPAPSWGQVLATEAVAWVLILLACALYVRLVWWFWSGEAAQSLPFWLATLAAILALVVVPAIMLLALLAFAFGRPQPRTAGLPFPPPPARRAQVQLSRFTETAAEVVFTPVVAAVAAASVMVGGALMGGVVLLRGLGISFPSFGGRGLAGGSASMGSGLTSGNRGTAAPPRTNWLTAAASRWSQEALAAAFVKWMETFQADPERALPFAVPIGGDPASPQSPPTQEFAWTRRDVMFRLESLFGPTAGGGGGSIVLPPWLVDALGDRYRAEAERLFRMKEFRRAAYIYGTLLRDYRMAADCMEREGAWREAAELHLRRLQDPAAAARCLEQAGLFREAAELRETLAQWLPAAKLYARIEDSSRAERCFRLAARDFRRQGDHQAAGDVFRDHLKDVPAAREEYFLGWNAERTTCLAPWLALSAPPHLPEPDLGPLERKLAELQTAAPLFALLQAARSARPAAIPDLPDRLLPAVQKVVARWLPKTSSRLEAAELIENLAWCNRNDPRVGRDGRRFLDAQRPAVAGTSLQRS